MLYKNASMLRRLVANVIDWVLIIGFSAVFVKLLQNKGEIFNPINYYLPIVLILVWLNFYFICTPIITKGATLGYLILRIKMIDNKTKTFKVSTILKRNILIIFAMDIVFIVLLASIWPSDIEWEKKTQEGVTSLIKDTTFNKFIIQFIIMSFNIILFVNFFGFCFGMLNKKRLTLIDFFSKSRVVDAKFKQPLDNKTNVELLPFYNNQRKYKYFVSNQIEQLENYDFKED
ncbi:RDD family protein [Mycoplasma hafezii]|uniref:RDD family protein n=1 Tax=Mycoplasma hafezii TaxID=525886 RepID=UPI003CF89E59